MTSHVIQKSQSNAVMIEGKIAAEHAEPLGQILETLHFTETQFVGMCVEAAVREWQARGRLSLPLRLCVGH
jgi:hypothetical protein